MKRLFLLTLLSSSLFAWGVNETGYDATPKKHVIDDFDLNIWGPKWQLRKYYHGILPSSIGYFYLNNLQGTIGIYGSNRYLSQDETNQDFYESLLPFEEHLMPFATNSWNTNSTCELLEEEECEISGLPALKLTFKVSAPRKNDELVFSYLIAKETKAYLMSCKKGYTFSLSCNKSDLTECSKKLQMLVNQLRIIE